MSRLRPTLPNAAPNTPCMRGGTAYLMILNAVQSRRGLIHGKLHDHGESCAIGSYFAVNSKSALPSDLIDEVAAINDSMPHVSERQRKVCVARWLRWKLTEIGMPGFRGKVVP